MLSAIKNRRVSDPWSATLCHWGVRFALGIALALVLSGSAWAEFNLTWFTIDGGGHTFSSGGPFTVGGTIGQPDAGTAAGGVFVLSGGFWLVESTLSSVPDSLVGPGDHPEGDPAVGADIPATFRIELGRANPFQHHTEIRLELPESRDVTLRVFDYSGRLVQCVFAGQLPAGYCGLTWDGTDGRGRPVPSGSYLIQVRAGDTVSRRRVVLLR